MPWSDELRSQTEAFLREVPVGAFVFAEKLRRKGIILKHDQGGYGYLTFESASSGVYELHDIRSDAVVVRFTDVKTLLAGGWAID